MPSLADLGDLTEWDKAMLRWRLLTDLHPDPAKRRPNQVTPKGDWHTWLLLSGRGFGKTRVGAEDCIAFASRAAGSRQAIIAEDFGAARDVCMEGESGILSILPDSVIKSYNRSMGQLVLINGARLDLFSGEKPDDLRGPQFNRAWIDELAKMRYQRAVWDMLSFALRLGTRPQVVVTTTPRPTDLIIELMEAPSTHLTRGSTFDNAANLPQSFLDDLVARYEGRALGRQELYAELVMDFEGALVRRTWIKQTDSPPPLERIAVGVDPSSWGPEAGIAYDDSGKGVETGIVVAGIGIDGDTYVLEDASMRGSPNEWAGRALDVYHSHDADALVVEVNIGPWVVSTIRGVEQSRGLPPARIVNVRPGRGQGKSVRLEPVAGLYEQGRVTHVGYMTALDDQLVSWDPRQRWSPDRIDALVHAVTWLAPWRGSEPAETGLDALRAASLNL